MAAVNSSSSSSSIFNSYGIKNKGLGGLLSGLDTESLVQALTSSTRSKIAQQGQQKQVLQWRQSAYRSVSSVLYAFQTKNLSFASSSASTSNIASPTFFNAFKATTASDKVTVTTTSNSKASDITIDSIKQLATYHTMTSESAYDLGLSQKLTGDVIDLDSSDFTGKTLSIRIDNTAKVIKLDSLNGLKAEEIGAQLQYLVDEAFGTKTDLSTGKQVSKMTVNVKNLIGSSAEQTITTPDEEGGADKVTTIPASLGKLQLDFSSDDSRITITSDTEKASVLGFDGEQTNRVQLSTQIKDIKGFGDKLVGDQFVLNINGAEIKINAADTINTMMSKINSSGAANVRMTYSSADDTFTISSKVPGGGDNLQMEDVSGNLLSTLFGAKGGSQITSKTIAVNTPVAAESTMTNSNFINNLDNLRSMTFNITIGDDSRSISLDVFSDDDEFEAWKSWATGVGNIESVMKSFADGFNQKLADTFDSAADGVKLKVVKDEGGNSKFAMSSENNTSFSIRSNTNNSTLDAFKFLGFSGAKVTNVVDTSDSKLAASLVGTKLSQLGITNGEITIKGGNEDGSDLTFTYNSDMTLKDFIDASKGLITVSGGRLVMDTKNGFSDTSNGLNTFFGIPKNDAGQSYKSTSVTDAFVKANKDGRGQNAEIIVNGKLQSNNTNDFTIDGTIVTINKVSELNDDGTVKDAPIKISVTANPDEIVTRVKSFIDEYNTIMTSLYSLINEGKNSDYSPLTDEQKSDMTAAEIEKWETEAKKGLLSNDSTLRNIAEQMRQTFYTVVESAGISAYQAGISTASYDYTGKLQLNEDKLRSMVTQNPDAIRDLFTNSENGIATKLNRIIDKAVNSSSDPEKRGSLVKLAGTTAPTGDSSSSIGSKINIIDRYIATLKSRLESEYTRYWKQFSSLETSIQKLNSQSSWLNQS